jgi:very-short-patch-repair endonuclease
MANDATSHRNDAKIPPVSIIGSIARKRIEDLRMRLLDLTNANRLLNYKFGARSRRQIRLVDELPDQILARLEDGKRLTFRALPEPPDEPADEKADRFLLALDEAKQSDAPYLEAMVRLGEEELEGDAARAVERALRDRVRTQLEMGPRPAREQISKSDWARQNGIEPGYDLPKPRNGQADKESHADSYLQTLLFPEEMERTLSTINDLARTALQETGVNTLYLAIGYLEWYEAEQAQSPMYAPLLLHPIDIERKLKAGKYRYSIGSLGEETQINITLSARLGQDGRRLPPYKEDDTPESYLRRVERQIKDLPRWRVRRFAVVGHFAFARLVMFHDLEDKNWAGGAGVISSKLVAELLARTESAGEAFFAEEYHVDDPVIAAKVPLLITDADSSQFSAIADVMDGRNLAIKGPPGTGKSQTITNMIAAALAKGQSVLFVAEKMAALNVVKDRLEHAGLGQFCFELHSTKARKKDVLEALEHRLSVQGRIRTSGELEAALKQLERTRVQLTAYVETINRPFGAIGKTIHGILWSEQLTRRGRDLLPPTVDRIELQGAIEMTRHDVESLRGRLEVLADAWAGVAADGIENHPWFGIGNASLDYFEREQLEADLKAWHGTFEPLATALAGIEHAIQVPIGRTAGDAGELADALDRLPGPVGELPTPLYASLEDASARAALARFAEDQATWGKAQEALAATSEDPELLAGRGAELQALARLVAEAELGGKFGEVGARAEVLADEAERLARAGQLGRRFAEAFGIDAPITAETVRKLVSGVRLAAALSHDLRVLRHSGLYEDAAADLLNEGKARADDIAERLKPVSERLSVELEGEARDYRRPARNLRAATFPSRLWSRDVRDAKRQYRELLRRRIRVKRNVMIEDFEAIASCLDIAAKVSGDKALEVVCGPHFKGHETDFERLIAVNGFARLVRSTHGAWDAVDGAIQAMLLEGPSENVGRIATLAANPEVEAVLKTIDGIDAPRREIESLRTRAAERAAKAEELLARSKALGLKPGLDLRLLPDVAKVATARIDAEAAIEANSRARTLLGSRWQGHETAREPILAALAAAEAVEAADLPPALRLHLYHSERDARIAKLTDLAPGLRAATNGFLEKWRGVADLGDIDEKAFFGLAVKNGEMALLEARIGRALAAPEQLSAWVGYLVARRECAESGLGEIVAAFEGSPLEHGSLAAALLRTFYRTLARKALAVHPEVGQFRGLQLDKAREQFRKLDEESLELQRKALSAELCRRPIDHGLRGASPRDYTGLELIRHEIGKQKRHVPIRTLLDRSGRAIQQMKPCFMMSPLSVAQFLRPGGLRFDLLVIDEASQMRPEEALGALARAMQVVVVGDPNQLPPTSFFDRVDRPADEELDEEDVVDNESILDLALTEFRPARALRWHYRSRHESLIAFSNREFYGKDLIVFPSPLDPERERRDPQLGVYHRFVGGRYKGHVNIEEAQAVAESAVDFMTTHPDQSLGIVTLNQAQRELLALEIDRLVTREPPAQRYLERWENTLESFFVKNLENVQGDERDVIFISTVYGPDAETGVVMNRFGPINGRYGHRRLNVLFTRAKDRVEISTSLRPGDIRIGEGSQPGMHALKAYLEYAETGRLETGVVSGREADSEFEEIVRERLVERGYEVVPQVGVAGYFIDLAVRHPNRSGYLLGIECDGATYHSSRSARDRDRLRQTVLERLKWQIYRIWSTDWFHNPDQELKRLLAHMETLAREEAI